MNLRQKLYKIFDVLIPEGSSDKAIIRELDRRGKLTSTKALTEILFLLIDEIEELQERVKPKK